jgi:O-antigen/teichoic acid export membrane protein
MSLSLRSFHVFFIAVSILLSIWVGVWGIASYRDGGGASGLALAALFLVVALVLFIYWVRVRRKFREMGPED